MGINRRKSSVRLNCFASTFKSNRGFTLVELLVVTAIIGVLASMTLITISDFKDKTRVSRCAAEIRGIEKDIIAYASEKGTYPPDENAAGMEALKNMLDPWGNKYVYFRITDPNDLVANRNFFGQSINTDFDLYSKGPQGIDTVVSVPSIQIGNGIDDIIRAGDGSFVGYAEKYGL